MASLRASMVEVDITPRFHPTFGAWGTTPHMTEIHMPLKTVCLVLEQDGKKVVWFGLDLVGEPVKRTEKLRAEVADALGLTMHDVIWSTSQTHSPGALPGSTFTGSSITKLTTEDPDPGFAEDEYKTFMSKCIGAAKQAIQTLQPVKVFAGHGNCDTMSYNTRLPMPTSGNKFSRHQAEGLQSGKFFDTTIGLVRFEDMSGKPLGVVFNFCCHPATMIMDKYLSPDWVGKAREVIEDAVGGAPAMFVQGFCGDVNSYNIFGTKEQTERNGLRLGKAAVEALPNLIPVRTDPLLSAFRPAEIKTQRMPTREQFLALQARWQAWVDLLDDDPTNTWFDGVNLPEQFTAEQKKVLVKTNTIWIDEGLRMLEAGEEPRTLLYAPMYAIRFGDVAAVTSPGENFTETGAKLRDQSPFQHTLVCGDTNGLFGYISTDVEIDRGGSEPERNWQTLYMEGFRLPPAKGAAQSIVSTGVELLRSVR